LSVETAKSQRNRGFFYCFKFHSEGTVVSVGWRTDDMLNADHLNAIVRESTEKDIANKALLVGFVGE